MEIFKKAQYTESFRIRMGKMAETAIKCLYLLLIPTVISLGISLLWYVLVYRQKWDLGDGMVDIIATALLPVFGIIYGIVVANIAVQTVWSEYKTMRTAVKRYDLDTFMDLRDEDLSPLIRMICGSIAFGLLAGFMVLKYPNGWAGTVIVFFVTFYLALIHAVIIEIDDPCSGIWYIKNIPEEWLSIDPKKYRADRCEKIKKGMQAMIAS